MNMTKIISWILNHKRTFVEAVIGALLALSITYGTIVHNNNKKLSEELSIAQNNIEAYQGIVNDAQQANNVLIMDMEQLKNSNDSLLHQLDVQMKKSKIKSSDVKTAATQTQSLLVSASKGVGGDILSKDTIYTDSIQYNPLTLVYYTIKKDSIDIKLDVKNTQYLYTYKKRQYKNNKNFFKRLITLDFKKVDRYKYEIINTNDLIKESDIRVVEQK